MTTQPPSNQLADGTNADVLNAEVSMRHAESHTARVGGVPKQRVGRPALGQGESQVLQIRLDRRTRSQLDALAERECTTASAVVRNALDAWLAP
jgi:hypothetical protein